MVEYKRLFTFVSAFSVLCVAVIILLSILLASSNGKNDSKTSTTSTTAQMTTSQGTTSPGVKVCDTKACINAANLILNNIDEDQDPCEDFNLFSCGNFIKTRRIPSDAGSTDTFTDLRTNLANALSDSLEEKINDSETEATKNAKRYYQSCINEEILETDGLKNLLDVVNGELGGCSLTNPTYDANSESTFDKVVKFASWGLRPLFDVYISSNPKDPEVYVVRLQQSNWYLTKKTYQDSDPKVIEAYKGLMKNIFGTIQQTQDLNGKIDRLFELEKSMALATLDAEQRRNQTYQNYTIKKLNDDYPGFDWVEYIVKRLFGNHPDVNVTEDEPILMVDFDYFKKVLAIYQDATQNKKDDFHNLLIWSFIKPRSGFLSKKFRDFQLEFDKIYSGTTSTAPRARTCANAIADRMPYAVGRLYVEKNFDEKAKAAATEMIKNIREEFKIMLSENEWMDDKSKVSAREKADLMDEKIGYPDYTYNNTYLNEIYKDYVFSVNNYLENSLKTAKNDYQRALSELREKRDKKDWITGPAIVNAFYSSTNNQISFPAGILQAPFYDSNFPKYLNYGGIGSVIGHEITHGFDDQGRRYDKNGVFIPDGEPGLWTEQTIQNYKSKAQCIVDQYSNYVAKQVNEKIRGFQTQGENIADNGGVKESFRAYRRWAEKNGPEALLPGLTKYNQEQLFFINYAQVWCLKIRDQELKKRIETGVHSPGEFRIIGPTSNMVFFAEAFKCKTNSTNNPANKCSVW